MRNKSKANSCYLAITIVLQLPYCEGRTDMRPRGLAAARPCHPSGGKALTAVTTFCGGTRKKGRIVPALLDSRSDPYEYLPCLLILWTSSELWNGSLHTNTVIEIDPPAKDHDSHFTNIFLAIPSIARKKEQEWKWREDSV